MKKAKTTNTATARGLSLPAKIGIAAALVLAGVAAVYALKGQSGQAPDHHAAHRSAAAGNAAPAVASAGINKAPAPGQAPDGMAWVPGGAFAMGCDDCEMPDAKPVHPVSVNGFWMDKTPVTNAQFAQFVKATGYKTVAERKVNDRQFALKSMHQHF